MEYLIIGVLFGVVTAVIGSSKNRSAFGFFFLGLLLGPFGVLISIFMKKKDDPESLSETKKCPQCAETIKKEAVICRYCQSKLDYSERSHIVKSIVDKNDSTKRLAKCSCGHVMRYPSSNQRLHIICSGCSSEVILP